MKTLLHLAGLILLLAISAHPCLAMMSIEDVSKSRAKELGMEIHTNGAGPDATLVQLEFDVKGDLKRFARVDLEIHDRGKLQLFASLKEERPKPDRVAVSFSASRAQLENATLRVVTGFPGNYSGHDLRVKNFIDPQKAAAAPAAPAAPAATANPAAPAVAARLAEFGLLRRAALMIAARLAAGKVSTRIACSTGASPPPAMPCSTRKQISQLRLGARREGWPAGAR